MRSILRTLTYIILCISLSGCDIVRGLATYVQAVPTPLPTNTPYPTPTPQPGATATFNVQVPPNTPSGSSVILLFPDFVGGLATRSFILTNAGRNLWTGNVPAPIGSLLRYRYQRVTGAQTVGEVQPDGAAVIYRTALVTEPATFDDTVAAWADTPFVGDRGHVTGIVRDASSGQGLPGMIVSAAGQQATTGFDGEYLLRNVPANAATTVTAFAADGSFRAQQHAVVPPVNGPAFLDFSLWAAKTINVIFAVALPVGTVKGAPVRLAGDTQQLGDTLVVGPGGSRVAAQRQPVLTPLADGRWGTSLLLFEGIDLHYKYTLGNGYINTEVQADGSPVLRHFVLPGDDQVIIQDQIAAWHTSLDAPVSITVDVPASTPATDVVTLQLRRGGDWLDPVPMWRTGVTNWTYILYNPLDFAGPVPYRFCRNYQCGTADDAATAGPDAAGYRFTPTLLPQALQNRVAKWQWWDDPPPVTTVIPAIAARPGFHAGFELAPWSTADAPSLPSALDAIKSSSADWVRIPIVWSAASANPPLITFDFRRSLPRTDLVAAIRAARDRGFKVALYPQVRPARDRPLEVDLHTYFELGARDAGWWDGWFREYARFLAYYADVAAFTGSDMLYVGDSSLARALPAGGAPADAETRWRSIIAAVRRDHYAGPLAFALELSGQVPHLAAPAPPFLDAVDVVDIRLSAGLTPSPTASLDEVKNGAGAALDTQVLPLHAQYGKFTVVTALYPSTDGGATGCIGFAGGGCQPVANVAPDQPYSNLYPTDLNEQALAYEAILHAILDRPWVSGFYAFGYDVPVALRDRYYSPRGKTSEAVLATWFPRLK